jgi:uncharacterized protein (TIGR02596 family)
MSRASARHRASGSRCPGFSLLELLLVITIIVVMSTLLTIALGYWRGLGVSNGGRMVMEDMAFAQELAIANNQPSEIWFIRKTGGTFIEALQTYLVDQNGVASAYSPVHHFASNTRIDSGTYLSPLFAASNSKQWTGNQTQPQIPGYQTSYDCWFVRFMPDGSTTLPTTQGWFLTVHEQSSPNGAGALPVNYAMVSIDPLTGKLSLYRP